MEDVREARRAVRMLRSQCVELSERLVGALDECQAQQRARDEEAALQSMIRERQRALQQLEAKRVEMSAGFEEQFATMAQLQLEVDAFDRDAGAVLQVKKAGLQHQVQDLRATQQLQARQAEVQEIDEDELEELQLRCCEHEALASALLKVTRELQDAPDNTHRLEQWQVSVSNVEKRLLSSRSELETAQEIRKSCMDDVASRVTELDEECALHTWTTPETETETDCDSCVSSANEECFPESLEELRVRYSSLQKESSALSQRIQSKVQERQLVMTLIQDAEAELRHVRLAAMFSTPQNTWLDCASLCDTARGAVIGCSRLFCGFRIRAVSDPPSHSVSLTAVTC